MISIDISININKIINKKGYTKKELINKIRQIEPHTTKTGNIPSESTLYAYLNCTLPIPLNTIPYIADALGVPILEIFSYKEEIRNDYLKYSITHASDNFIYNLNKMLNSKLWYRKVVQ